MQIAKCKATLSNSHAKLPIAIESKRWAFVRAKWDDRPRGDVDASAVGEDKFKILNKVPAGLYQYGLRTRSLLNHKIVA